MNAEQTEANLLVVRAFDTLRIPYLLCGSMASSIHGIYRATADADFVAAIRPHQAEAFARLLQPAFYADAPSIQIAAESGRSFNVIHLMTMLKVDVFAARDEPFHQTQMQRRIWQAVDPEGHSKMFIASAEDTVLAKLDWYRQGGEVSDRQWRDVLGVLKVQGDALDRAYLREWAGRLALADLFRRACDDAGLAPDCD